MLTKPDGGGRGGPETPNFGWRNMWTAPYRFTDKIQCEDKTEKIAAYIFCFQTKPNSFYHWKLRAHYSSKLIGQICHSYVFRSSDRHMRNWSSWGRRRVRNAWWLIFYCLPPAQILKVIVGLWRRQSLIPSLQIVPVWGKNGGYVKNYQLSWERLINFGKHPFTQSCTNKRTSKSYIRAWNEHYFINHFTLFNAGVI